MLRQLHCSHGHFWETDGADEAPDVRSVFCPVCGDVADSVPLLDLAAIPTHTPGADGPGEPGPVADEPPLCDEQGRPVVAGYEILEDLGKAHAGVLRYRARHTLLNRPVLLEVVLAKDDPGQVAWGALRGSAHALARLPHPHILSIFDAGERDRQLFYNALEPIEGPTLAELLDGKPWPMLEAAALVELLARAVAFAHQRGAIHRALKPASVLLDPLPEKAATPSPAEGWVRLRGRWYRPRLTDFGLHRRPVEGEPTDLALQGERPCWLSPEQAWGHAKEIGPATDIYGLGAILYELLTGRPPFHGETALQTLDQVMVFDLIPPEVRRPSLSADLAAVCRKALSKRPEKRYSSALRLAEDLRAFREGRPVQAREPGGAEVAGRWCRRHPVLVGVLLAFLAGWFAAGRWSDRRDPEENHSHRSYANRLNQQLAEAQLELRAMREELRSWAYAGKLTQARHELAAKNDALAQALLGECPVESRGWEWHYLQRHLLEGQPPILSITKLADPVRSLAFQPEGNHLAVGTGTGHAGGRGEVHLWNIGTGRERFTMRGFAAPVRALAWHPKGWHLVAGSDRRGFGPNMLRIWNSGGVEWNARQFDIGMPGSFAYSADGRQLLVAGRDGRVELIEPFGGETAEVIATPEEGPRTDRLLTTRAVFCNPEATRLAWISRDGREILTRDELGRRVPLSFQGDRPEIVALAAHSPSGLLAAAGRDRSVRLWSLGQETIPYVLRGFQGTVLDLAFSPDGKRLATVETEGVVRIWDVQLGQELLSFAGPAGPNPVLAFGPTGRMLAVGNGNEVVVWGTR